MDRAISASEANQGFSRMLRDVAAGDSFTVLSRRRPVARVVPIAVEPADDGFEGFMERMRERPARCAGNWTREDLYD